MKSPPVTAANRAVKIAGAVALLAIGTVTGPILIAVVTAALSETYESETEAEAAPPESAFVYSRGETADLLFRAYEPHRPPPLLRTDVDIPRTSYWADCGYPQELDGDPRLLTSDMRVVRDAPRPGQAALTAAFAQLRLADQERATIERLDRATSTFSAVFLRRCIESTLARNYCVAEVTARLEGDPWERYGHGELPAERKVRCQLLDGVAARNGLELADRPPIFGETN